MSPMRFNVLRRHVVLALALAVSSMPVPVRAADNNTGAPASDVTAINILLELDPKMLSVAKQNNARLRKVFPAGFALDAAHVPHITIVQRFVRTTDLAKVYAAAGTVVARADVRAIRLEAEKRSFLPTGQFGVAGIVVRPAPELSNLQSEILTAIAPFVVESGTSAAFVTMVEDPIIDPMLIHYVATFVPRHTAQAYTPHVTTGVAPRGFLDELMQEPFAPFAFAPAGVALYQLGQFGTAAKLLKRL